jgi:3-oxoacyl-[acyl-carrier-protein] synthase-3
MQGNQVFKHAVRVMCQSAVDVLEKAGLTADDVDLVVPHQANNRIIEALAQRLDIKMDKFKINLDRYGNTSAASVPIALAEAFRNGRINPGDNILRPARSSAGTDPPGPRFTTLTIKMICPHRDFPCN